MLGALFCFGQKDYTREEKLLFQRFKIANRYFEDGKKYFLKEEYKNAEKNLKKCLEKMPEHSGACFFLSQISDKKGNLDRALELIEKAKENFAKMDRIKTNVEQLYILELQEQKSQKEERLREVRQGLSNVAPDDRSKVESAIGAMEGEIATINSRLTKPIPTEEEMPADYFYLHGNIFFKLRKFEEAYAQYQEAIRINPKFGDAYNNLANLYYMSKQYQKALECLNQAETSGAEVNQALKKAVLKALGKDDS
jgi:tetratricopeptide (TPR) repeat protein